MYQNSVKFPSNKCEVLNLLVGLDLTLAASGYSSFKDLDASALLIQHS
jgi:hypothetical protein